jgi:hypothetical protein
MNKANTQIRQQKIYAMNKRISNLEDVHIYLVKKVKGKCEQYNNHGESPPGTIIEDNMTKLHKRNSLQKKMGSCIKRYPSGNTDKFHSLLNTPRNYTIHNIIMITRVSSNCS